MGAVEKTVLHALRKSRNGPRCDACVSQIVGLDAQKVREVCLALVERDKLRRLETGCPGCGVVRLVNFRLSTMMSALELLEAERRAEEKARIEAEDSPPTGWIASALRWFRGS